MQEYNSISFTKLPEGNQLIIKNLEMTDDPLSYLCC